MSMRCGRLQMILPLGGGGEKAGITRFCNAAIIVDFRRTDKLQFLNLLVRKANLSILHGFAIGLLRAATQQKCLYPVDFDYFFSGEK